MIFNWKGDLQKDHILSTLGIMTRAAKNISNDSNINHKKFGHLHIIFRDWQSIDDSSEEVYQSLFDLDLTNTNPETIIHNQIRQDIIANKLDLPPITAVMESNGIISGRFPGVALPEL